MTLVHACRVVVRGACLYQRGRCRRVASRRQASAPSKEHGARVKVHAQVAVAMAFLLRLWKVRESTTGYEKFLLGEGKKAQQFHNYETGDVTFTERLS